MDNKTQLFNKIFVDMFIEAHYMGLSAKFRALKGRLNEKGNSPLDKLNDVVMGLYLLDMEFVDYLEFEKFANHKFKNSIDAINRKIRKAEERKDK